MKEFFQDMRTNEIKNETGQIKEWEEKLKEKIWNMKQEDTYMIFRKSKQ